eukprot:Rmarinus@m.21808
MGVDLQSVYKKRTPRVQTATQRLVHLHLYDKTCLPSSQAHTTMRCFLLMPRTPARCRLLFRIHSTCRRVPMTMRLLPHRDQGHRLDGQPNRHLGAPDEIRIRDFDAMVSANYPTKKEKTVPVCV